MSDVPSTPSRLPRPKATASPTPSSIPRYRPQGTSSTSQRPAGAAGTSRLVKSSASPKPVANATHPIAIASRPPLPSTSSPRPRVIGTVSRPRAPPSPALAPSKINVAPRPAPLARSKPPPSPLPPRVRTISQESRTSSRDSAREDESSSRRALPSIREQIAAKRKALQEEQAEAAQARQHEGDLLSETMDSLQVDAAPPSTGSSSDVFGRTVPSLIGRAMRSGRLDIGNLTLDRLPKQIWTKMVGIEESDLSIPYERSEPTDKAINAMREEAEEQVPDVPFYEQVDLIHLRASGNEIMFIEPEIRTLAGLKVLDLHGNKLRELPDSIIDLRELTHLDISSNQFNALPKCTILLPSLVSLNLSDNLLTAINLDDPVRASADLLEARRENGFFTSFPSTPKGSSFRDVDVDEPLPLLKELHLANNRITVQGLPKTWPRSLEGIDLASNNLQRRLDLASLASLPHLKYLNLKGNGLDNLVNTASLSWPALAAVDLTGNPLSDVEGIRSTFNVPKQVLLTKQPIKRSRMSLAAQSDRQLVVCLCETYIDKIPAQVKEVPPEHEAMADDTVSAPLGLPGPLHAVLPEPWSSCFDTVRGVLTITAENGDLVDTDGRLDLSALDGYACEGLTTINVSGILSLKSLHVAPIQALAQVTSVSVTNTRLRSHPDLLKSLASAMPRLKELDLSGSMLSHLDGVDSLVANGLQLLRVQGANVSDITALVTIAEAVRAGTWTGTFALEDIDLRDNAIEKLPPIIGFLPLRSLLVDNNAFLAPPRRVWEREGTKGLLQWLMDRA